jgi:sigma-B regulation protein RsbU (phosphoserine phosphatase)
MIKPPNEIDAQTFFEAAQLDNESFVQGAELQRIFWRFKALEKELTRQKAFWKSTNDTLSQAFSQTQAQEKRLHETNRLLSQSYAQLQALTNRLQHELTLARQIQQSLLPPANPTWAGPNVFCYSIPAFEVGGDFYDYHPLSDTRFALAVGDVSDKGMSAALLMAISLAHFDSAITSTRAPNEVLAYLDHVLVRYTKATHQNCALCYVEVDGLNLHIANAGGIPPYIRRATGEVIGLEVGGMPLGTGIGAQSGYEAITVKLVPNDIVVLTSDGVVEANTGNNKLFGFERLERAIAHGPISHPEAMLDHLTAEVRAFVGDAEPHDDLTIVVFQVKA